MRPQGWEDRLAAYLLSVKDRPFEWGLHDCALHAASAAQAVTGVDTAAAYRGRYSTARGSARALRRIGHGTLEASFGAAFEEIEPAFAGRGDLVMADGSIGVCIGGTALFVGAEGAAEGLVRIARPAWTKAWRV